MVKKKLPALSPLPLSHTCPPPHPIQAKVERKSNDHYAACAHFRNKKKKNPDTPIPNLFLACLLNSFHPVPVPETDLTSRELFSFPLKLSTCALTYACAPPFLSLIHLCLSTCMFTFHLAGLPYTAHGGM